MAPLLDHYGYLAVAGLLFLENLGAPIVPGETMLIAGAIYAGAGRMNVVVLGLVAVAACVAGACGGWAIGWFGGRGLAERYGRYVFLTAKRLDRAERFFASRGAFVITFARFLEGLRQANGVIAGLTQMRWIRFLIFNGIGATVWVAVWVSVGYLTGNHITAIYDDVTKYLLYVLIALAVAVAVLIARHLLRRRRAADISQLSDRKMAAGGRPEGRRPPPTALAGSRVKFLKRHPRGIARLLFENGVDIEAAVGRRPTRGSTGRRAQPCEPAEAPAGKRRRARRHA